MSSKSVCIVSSTGLTKYNGICLCIDVGSRGFRSFSILLNGSAHLYLLRVKQMLTESAHQVANEGPSYKLRINNEKNGTGAASGPAAAAVLCSTQDSTTARASVNTPSTTQRLDCCAQRLVGIASRRATRGRNTSNLSVAGTGWAAGRRQATRQVVGSSLLTLEFARSSRTS